MIEARRINIKKFKDVMTHAFEQRYLIDLTDYDNWVGFRDFLEYAWGLFKEKQLVDGDFERMESNHETKYRRLFWKIYYIK